MGKHEPARWMFGAGHKSLSKQRSPSVARATPGQESSSVDSRMSCLGVSYSKEVLEVLTGTRLNHQVLNFE